MGRRLACALLLFTSAVAQGQSLKIEVRTGDPPAVVLTPTADVVQLSAELQRDGRPLRIVHGAIVAGEAAQLSLPGAGRYDGKLVVRFASGQSSTFTARFTVGGSSRGLKIGYDRDHLDLDARRLSFTLSRPAAHAELRVIGETGEEIDRAAADFPGAPAGTWLSLSWGAPGRVLALELKATATDGGSVKARLVPWSVRIPHQEVVFASGQATLAAAETQKLEASYRQIESAVATVRKAEPNLAVRLYIAGHTDTVGSAADNLALSLARARAIATWFRDRGLPLKVAYAGLGESAPAVPTPDNTDEARNRRADYIVGVEEPRLGRGLHPVWHLLR